MMSAWVTRMQRINCKGGDYGAVSVTDGSRPASFQSQTFCHGAKPIGPTLIKLNAFAYDLFLLMRRCAARSDIGINLNDVVQIPLMFGWEARCRSGPNPVFCINERN